MFMWNRTELMVTLSQERYMQARALLQKNKIKTQGKQVRENIGGRHKDGYLYSQETQYYLFVDKNDFEKAAALIEKLFFGNEEEENKEDTSSKA